MKIDSSRVLAQPGWQENVIDVDTYGSPWKHWAALLPNVTRPTTVFLTVGWVNHRHGSIGTFELAAMGLRFKRLAVPPGIWGRLARFSIAHLFALAADRQLRTVEIVEAACVGGARYFGVRIEPAVTPDPVRTE